jgi:hypothetical protein
MPIQSLFPEPLSIQSGSVQFLKALWEKTQDTGAHSFEVAMTESTFPQQKVNAFLLTHIMLNQDLILLLSDLHFVLTVQVSFLFLPSHIIRKYLLINYIWNFIFCAYL